MRAATSPRAAIAARENDPRLGERLLPEDAEDDGVLDPIPHWRPSRGAGCEDPEGTCDPSVAELRGNDSTQWPSATACSLLQTQYLPDAWSGEGLVQNHVSGARTQCGDSLPDDEHVTCRRCCQRSDTDFKNSSQHAFARFGYNDDDQRPVTSVSRRASLPTYSKQGNNFVPPSLTRVLANNEPLLLRTVRHATEYEQPQMRVDPRGEAVMRYRRSDVSDLSMDQAPVGPVRHRRLEEYKRGHLCHNCDDARPRVYSGNYDDSDQFVDDDRPITKRDVELLMEEVRQVRQEQFYRGDGRALVYQSPPPRESYARVVVKKECDTFRRCQPMLAPGRPDATRELVTRRHSLGVHGQPLRQQVRPLPDDFSYQHNILNERTLDRNHEVARRWGPKTSLSSNRQPAPREQVRHPATVRCNPLPSPRTTTMKHRPHDVATLHTQRPLLGDMALLSQHLDDETLDLNVDDDDYGFLVLDTRAVEEHYRNAARR